MNKTKIFPSYEAFLNREDKSVNGVSLSFAKRHSHYEGMNATNKGCWDCYHCDDCEGCRYCVSCEDCKDCIGCDCCKGCVNCKDCDTCLDCKDCELCSSCEGCFKCIDFREKSGVLNGWGNH